MTGWVAAAAGATALAAWAVRGRSSQLFGSSIWRGDTTRRAIALTFDDGPTPGTAAILEILERHRARATFFQVGAHAERLSEQARAVTLAGHEIGNHTQNHAALWLRRPGFVEQEIAQAQATLTAIHGAPPRWFRAPYGVRWFGVGTAQRRHRLTGVMWTAIARDWILDANQVVNRLLRAAQNGAILCLHDGRGTQPAADITTTIEALRRLAPQLVEQGYDLVTVSDLLCPTISKSA
jgi:peptidoglycan/xylan/chitin deacetylase (PgdA/CDA1 family)